MHDRSLHDKPPSFIRSIHFFIPPLSFILPFLRNHASLFSLRRVSSAKVLNKSNHPLCRLHFYTSRGLYPWCITFRFACCLKVIGLTEILRPTVFIFLLCRAWIVLRLWFGIIFALKLFHTVSCSGLVENGFVCACVMFWCQFVHFYMNTTWQYSV